MLKLGSSQFYSKRTSNRRSDLRAKASGAVQQFIERGGTRGINVVPVGDPDREAGSGVPALGAPVKVSVTILGVSSYALLVSFKESPVRTHRPGSLLCRCEQSYRRFLPCPQPVLGRSGEIVNLLPWRSGSMPSQPAHHLVERLEGAIAHAHHKGVIPALDGHLKTERIGQAIRSLTRVVSAPPTVPAALSNSAARLATSR